MDVKLVSAKRSGSAENTNQLRLSERLALRPREAANVLGLSERLLRQILPQLPHLRVGSAVLIPVDSLRDWLREQEQLRESEINTTVREVVESFDDS